MTADPSRPLGLMLTDLRSLGVGSFSGPGQSSCLTASPTTTQNPMVAMVIRIHIHQLIPSAHIMASRVEVCGARGAGTVKV